MRTLSGPALFSIANIYLFVVDGCRLPVIYSRRGSLFANYAEGNVLKMGDISLGIIDVSKECSIRNIRKAMFFTERSFLACVFCSRPLCVHADISCCVRVQTKV